MDEPDPEYETQSLVELTTGVVLLGLVTATTGAAVAESAENLVVLTGFSGAVVGTLFMAVATSVPELVTSVAAVREGAVTLAVSDIVGGTSSTCSSSRRPMSRSSRAPFTMGPAVGYREVFLIALAALLNVVFLGGLLYRQQVGPAKIGVEGVAMILIYLAGVLVLGLGM